MMKTIEKNLASGFDKIRKIDVLDSVLADCEGGGTTVMADKIKSKPKLRYFAGLAAALAVIICAVFAISGDGLQTNPLTAEGDISARIYLDVNPSIEISVDRAEKVIDVIADNPDGESIIDGRDFKGNGLEDTVAVLVERMVEEEYLSNTQNSLLLSVAAENGDYGKKLEERMSQSVYKLLSGKSVDGAVLSQTITKTDDEIERLARMYNISIGRAQMIKDILDVENSYTFESLASLSVNDLSIIRENLEFKNSRISVNGRSNSCYISYGRAVELALNGLSRSSVSDVKVKLERRCEGKKSIVRYHVTYKMEDGELRSYYLDAVTGEIVDSDQNDITTSQPVVTEEYAKQKAIEFACKFDGITEDTLEIKDCIIAYDENGYPRQYVTMNSLTDSAVMYYAYVYDESRTVSNYYKNVYGGKLVDPGMEINDYLNMVIEKSGIDDAVLNHYLYYFGSAEYHRFYFENHPDDFWYVNRITKEVICGNSYIVQKYGGYTDIDEIKQYAISKLDKWYNINKDNFEIVSIEKSTYNDVIFFITVRDNTPGKINNTIFVQMNVYDQDDPTVYMRTDDELMDIICRELGIKKSECKDIRTSERNHIKLNRFYDERTNVYFTNNGTDYWCVISRGEYAAEKIEGFAKKSHDDNDYPIISEKKAIDRALYIVDKRSVDDLESYEVKYDDEKKQYTVSMVLYGAKYQKNVYWEIYVDAYTGIQLGHKFDDKADYGEPHIEQLTEEEAIDLAFTYIEKHGYQRSGMKVTVEAEKIEREFPITCYHITALENVTKFEVEINSDEKNYPVRIARGIDYDAVMAGKTGKYISEDIAKEIALSGMKDIYTVVSCKIDESGELAIYEITLKSSIGGSNITYKISAESGMILETAH